MATSKSLPRFIVFIKDSFVSQRMVLGLFLVASIFSFACTKKRPDRFQQAQGEHLLVISDYDNKFFSLKTLGPVTEDGAEAKHSALENPLNDKKFSLVEYKTKAKFLRGDLPMLAVARDSKNYQILYKITDKLLKVYKVAKPDFIAYQERTYAAELADGRLAVPLLGYTIELVKVEPVRNSNEENTSRLTENRKTYAGEASHFRISENSPILFESISKQFIYPANLFDGEWYYAATLVALPDQLPGIISMDYAQDYGYDNSGDRYFTFQPRVQPYRLSDYLVFENSTKVEGQESADRNKDSLLKLPVTWMNLQVADDGTQKGLREESIEEDEYRGRSVDQLKYMRIHFEKIQPRFANISNAGAKLKSIRVTKDYIDFDVYYKSANVTIKYAFKRSGPVKKGRRYFKDDMKKIGFFYTMKPRARTNLRDKKEHFDQDRYIVRHYPKDGVIRFHFTKTSSKDPALRKMTLDSIESWNQVFIKAGSGLRVALMSEEVELGDLRYNVINLMDTATIDSPNGVAISKVEPLSGEIISAPVNIWVNEIREQMYYFLSNMIRAKRFLIESEIPNPEDTFIPHLANIADKKMGTWSNFVLENNNTNAEFSRVNLSLPDVKDKSPEMLKILEGVKHPLQLQSCSYSSSVKDLRDRVDKYCPKLSSYISKLAPHAAANTAVEDELVKECAKETLAFRVRSTLLHELGHAFGLLHNFKGSADLLNFSEEVKTGKPLDKQYTLLQLQEMKDDLVQFSTVMDYKSPYAHYLHAPGKYDLAAIRFAYGNRVLTKSGVVKKIDPERSLVDNFSKSKDDQLHPFMFCTDGDIHVANRDPMCARWDRGVTPKEVVDDIILGYKARRETQYNKWDRVRPYDQSRQYLASYFNYILYFLPIKRFYDHFRYLATKRHNLRWSYFEDLAGEKFDRFILSLENDKARFDNEPSVSEYREASKTGYEFLKGVVEEPNRYCNFIAGDAHKIIEFDTLKTRFYDATKQSSTKGIGKILHKCEDILSEKPFLVNILKDFMLENGIMDGLQMDQKLRVTDVGSFLRDYYIDENSNNRDQSEDVIGSMRDHIYAMVALTTRDPSYLNNQQFFFPSFMDEPVWRDEIGDLLLDRVLYGVSSKTLGFHGQNSVKATHYPRFTDELEMLKFMIDQYFAGMSVPFKVETTLERLAPWHTHLTVLPKEISQGKDMTEVGMYVATIMDNRRVKAQEIIRRRRDIEFIEKLVDSEELNESAFDFVLGQIKSVMPYKTDNGLAGMTAENFLSFYQTIQVVVQENLRSNNPLAQNATIHLTRMLEPMTEIFKFVNEEIKNSSSSVIADWQKEVFSEGKKTPIFKFIATDPKFSTSDILLTPERLDKRKKKYLQDYRRAKDPVDSYEIRAQKELLFHMLRH